MATNDWYQWVFDGLGIAILTWLGFLISKLFKKNKYVIDVYAISNLLFEHLMSNANSNEKQQASILFVDLDAAKYSLSKLLLKIATQYNNKKNPTLGDILNDVKNKHDITTLYESMKSGKVSIGSKDEQKLLALLAFLKSDLDFCLRCHKEILDNNPNDTEPLLISAIIYMIKSNFSMAEGIYTKLINLPNISSNKIIYAFSLDGFGSIFKLKGHLKDAENMFMKALEIFHSINHLKGEAIALFNLGIVYLEDGFIKKSREMFFRARDIYEKLNERLNRDSIDVYLAILLHKEGNDDSAEEILLRILENNTFQNNWYVLSVVYTTLGLIYTNKCLFDAAVEYHEKSLDISQKCGDHEGIIGAHANIGNIYSCTERYYKALEEYHKALDIARATNRKKQECTALSNIALLYDKWGIPEHAEQEYLSAIKISEECGYVEILAQTSYNYALFCLECNKKEQALKYVNISLDNYKILNLQQEIQDCKSFIKSLR